MFLLELSVTVTTTPESFARCEVSESVRLLEVARLIGIIELKVGISKPIAYAYKEADKLGKTDGLKPIESEKRIDHIPIMQGMDNKNPSTIEGSTNIAACVKIIATFPHFVKPTRRMTPVSKVLVSTEMSKRE